MFCLVMALIYSLFGRLFGKKREEVPAEEERISAILREAIKEANRIMFYRGGFMCTSHGNEFNLRFVERGIENPNVPKY